MSASWVTRCIDNEHLDRLRLPFYRWHHGISATVSHVDYIGRPHVIVLHQSNGFHLEMRNLEQAILFARRQAIQLAAERRGRDGVRRRVLVPAYPPISGELTF